MTDARDNLTMNLGHNQIRVLALLDNERHLDAATISRRLKIKHSLDRILFTLKRYLLIKQEEPFYLPYPDWALKVTPVVLAKTMSQKKYLQAKVGAPV